MRRRTGLRLSRGLWLAAMITAAAAFTFQYLGRHTPLPPQSFGFRGFAAVFAVVFATVGAVIASRRHENPIGWLFLVLGLSSGIQEWTRQYVLYAEIQRGALPAGEYAAWFTNWIWVPIVGLGTIVLFLLFPDGRLPSRRWRPFAAFAAVGISGPTVLLALVPGPTQEFPSITSPLGLGERDLMLGISNASLLLFTLSVVGSVIALGLRFRRSAGEERQQLKWVVFAASLLGAALVPALVLNGLVTAGVMDEGPLRIVNNLVVASFLGIPVAAGVAILRHGLYEIDVVINRAVVYGLLAAFVTALYIGIVVGIGAAAGRRGGLLLPGVAAAVVALVFHPARVRAQRLANRLVYGKRATPYEVLSEFSDRLETAYSLEDVLPRMARMVAEGTGAERAEVWLRLGDRLHRAAAWPTERGEAGTVPVTGDGLPALPGVDRALPVRHQGELLGALGVRSPRGESFRPSDEALLQDLASQAGLVLRNVRLIEEVRASRQRLVTAQDEERRRLERNIHDGAQQQLVALAVTMNLVERMVERDPARAAVLAAEARRALQEALDDLRDLARGIFPPLLADRGLAAALESQARKAAVPVTIEADGLRRYPQEVESAAYFCVLEALQNVAKYAGATRAVVRLTERGGWVNFEVEDDGTGFDPAFTPKGAGLQNMADRLEALGGTLEVRSAPGAGTTVAARIPVSEEVGVAKEPEPEGQHP